MFNEFESIPYSRVTLEGIMERVVQWFSPETLNATRPFPVREFWEFGLEAAFGVASDICDDLGPSVEGETDATNRVCRITSKVYRLSFANNGRARFTIAHECAHAILHTGVLLDDRSPAPLVFARRAGRPPKFRDPEWHANNAAAALLMPQQGVRAVAACYGWTGAEVVSQLMNRFQVSREAASVRLEVLARLRGQ